MVRTFGSAPSFLCGGVVHSSIWQWALPVHHPSATIGVGAAAGGSGKGRKRKDLLREVVEMLYRLSFEFRLTRLVPWASDGAEFYRHVENVRSKVAASEVVSAVRVISDVNESQLNFDLVVDASMHFHAESMAREAIRCAIESCDARHFGMEAVGMMSSAGARTGLLTPIWHQRRIRIDIAA